MLTLAIDTSSPLASVALLRGDAVLFDHSFAAGRKHSSQLFAVLEEALAIVPARELTRIVVGLGPGSYAGVRIGLSAAIGLSVASGAKLVGIPSIVGLGEGSYRVIGDARRESHYLAEVHGGIIISGPDLYPTAELTARLTESTLPLVATELPLDQLSLYGAELRGPSALRLATLAAQGLSLIETDPLEPIYLREPHITKATKAPTA